ncbi:MAG: hypothetical protein JWQ97_1074 [Phenylobacterium sp.]|nr:hypothetical protein [Phenylobacterium sp.]
MTLSRGRFWFLMTALVVAEITCSLESSMINVALAHLYGVYGDPVHVGWLNTIFSLTAAASAAVCSRLGDLYGRKKILLLMLATALVGSMLSFFAQNLGVIIVGRALQGASMSVLPLAFGILREETEPRQLNLGVGLLGGTFAFAYGLGSVLGGVIVDTGHWQGIFLVSGGVAALSLVLVWLAPGSRTARKTEGPLDLIGGAAVVLPIVAVLLGLTNARSQGWLAPLSGGLILAGIVGLVLWIWHELRQTNPLINVRLFKSPQIAVVNAVVFVTALGPLIYPTVVLPLLQQPAWTGVGLGLTATVAGFLKLLTNLGSGSAGIAAGYAAQRRGMRPMIILAAAVNVVGCGALIFFHGSVFAVIAIAVLMLAPAGTVIFACAPALIIEATPEDRTSEATGLTQVIRSFAQGIGTLMLAFTLATSSVSLGGRSFPDEQAYVATFIAMTLCALATLALAVFIPRRPVVAMAAEPAAAA